ncbi:MAG: type I methionyl aminopeptidase [Oscillospiraceae bacterium]|nr:type I methionyl aminopeptidase [Oscillospiraceae bacterium]
MISIKSAKQIEKMRESCKLTKELFLILEDKIKPGITTMELDTIAYNFYKKHGATPNFLNYNGFPGTICASVNDEVVHGIPSRHRVLKDGDIVSIDMGCILDGWHSDAARTFAVGKISDEAQRLIDITKQSFFEGIAKVKHGVKLGDVSSTIQNYLESNGFGVVRDLVGHGVGRELHEEPEVPNFGKAGRGVRLAAGMTLAIEPMVTAGDYHVNVLDDDWTVVTRDGSLAAHYENTIVVTREGCEILTL